MTYTNKPPELLKISENARKYTEVIYSIGVRLKEDGSVMDIIPGSPADKAGIGVTMKLVAVNGRRWTPAILRKAIDSTSTGTPLELLVEHHDFYKTCKLDYESGDKYPQLERDPSKPDLLSDITKPLVP